MTAKKRATRETTSVADQFRQFALSQQKVYFQPVHGNLGDDLIVMGIDELAARHSLVFSSQIDGADHLLVKGGGALLDVYPDLLEQFRKFFHDHRDVPTTLLPTSYLLHGTSLPEIVGPRSAPLRIFARERTSYDLLRELEFYGPVSLGLDHDTAFHLRESAYLKNLKTSLAPRHVLVVERIDPEALSNRNRFSGPGRNPATWKQLARKVIPVSVRAKIHELRHGRAPEPRHSPFASAALERIYHDHPQFRDLPVLALDVSSSRCCSSLEEFSSIIASAAVVYSTRLHVGILAAMLGIPVYVVEGVYHKISGIHEYSMSGMEHVRLVQN